MKHTLSAASIGILLAAMPVIAQAPSGNAEIRAVADAFDTAQQAGDRAALERLIAPDFLIVHASGKVGGKREFVEGFTKPSVRLEPFQITDRLFVRVGADAAIVGGEARVHGTADGKPFAEHFRYSDTFARRNGQWVVVYTQVTGLPR